MKVLGYLLALGFAWCLNYFALRIAGLLLGYTLTFAECTGIFILLLWAKCIVGGSYD